MVRALWTVFRRNLQWELAFRADALMAFLAGALRLTAGFLLFRVIYAEVEGIAGWSWPEALALLGTFSLISDLEAGLFRRGLHRLPDLVEEGKLDQYLVRPFSVPLLVALSEVNVQVLWRIPLSAGLLAYAWSLGPFLPGRFPLFFISFFMSLAIYVLFVFCLVALSFWFLEVNNLFWVAYDLVEFGRWPEVVYRGPIRWLFLTLLPFALLANCPVRVFFRGDHGLLLHQGLVLVGFALLGWGMWRQGLRRYQGAGG